MPRKIYPSSYECDCEHRSDFGEDTVNEMKSFSLRRKVRIGEGAREEHFIVFHNGKIVDLICPKPRKAT